MSCKFANAYQWRGSPSSLFWQLPCSHVNASFFPKLAKVTQSMVLDCMWVFDMAGAEFLVLWVMQQAERCGAKRLVLVAPDEWEQGLVRVKDQATREEHNVPVGELIDK
jgi:histidyl-tRNA synthetase